MLPQLDQQPLFNTVNFRLNNGPYRLENNTVVSVGISVLWCPSDGAVWQAEKRTYYGNANDPFDVTTYAPWYQQYTSYVGNAGTCDNYIASFNPNFGLQLSAMNGVIYGESNTQLRDITDGLSQTMLFGERAHSVLRRSDVAKNLYNPGYGQLPPDAFGYWHSGERLDTLYDTWNPPNLQDTSDNVGGPPEPDNDRDDSLFYNSNASSLHPGGVNFAFCDGSVHFIKNTIDCWRYGTNNLPLSVYQNSPDWSWRIKPNAYLGVYQRLSTRNLGEVVSADQY
jgi:prepilin-type processing-associated H-X9-DG protein